MSFPKYRCDAKGNLPAFKADCIATMRGEIRNADHFIVQWNDCTESIKEWGDFLTEAELKACFNKAQSCVEEVA